MRMSSGPSSRNEKPRSASSSCIEDTPRSSTTPSTAAWPNFSATRSSAEKRSSTSVSRPPAASHQTGAIRHRALVAVDADDLGVRRRRGSRGCSRRRRRCRRCRCRRREHSGARARAARARERDGPVRQRQQGHRCPPSFPCPERIFRRSLEAWPLHCSARRHGGSREARAEATRLPDWKGADARGHDPKRCIGLFPQSVTPAVWDCLAQHRVFGRENRSGVERPPPGNRTTQRIKGGLSLRNCLQSRPTGHGTWEPPRPALAKENRKMPVGTAPPVSGFSPHKQRTTRMPRDVANQCRCDIPSRFLPRFFRNIASAHTLSQRGDFAVPEQVQGGSPHAEETHDYDGHRRPDDRFGVRRGRSRTRRPPARRRPPSPPK